MNEWRKTWETNGWQNANGEAVANRDLIEESMQLEREAKKRGLVVIKWVERKLNKVADKAAKRALKEA